MVREEMKEAGEKEDGSRLRGGGVRMYRELKKQWGRTTQGKRRREGDGLLLNG